MTTLHAHQQAALKAFVEKIERLQGEQRALGEDIRELMREAQSKGFVPKVIRKVLAIRRQSKAEYLEQEAALAQYLNAVSWLATPLGAASEPAPTALPATLQRLVNE